MSNFREHRKYPRAIKKIQPENNEMVINLSLATAAGIAGVIFLKGMLLGYILKKRF